MNGLTKLYHRMPVAGVECTSPRPVCQSILEIKTLKVSETLRVYCVRPLRLPAAAPD